MWPMFCLKCLYLAEDKRPFYFNFVFVLLYGYLSVTSHINYTVTR